MSTAKSQKENRTQNISFRMTEEEYRAAEEWAAVEGKTVNDWCRKAVEERLREARGMSPETRIMYEEIARLRFLTGSCFRLFASDELDEETFEKVRATAEEKGAEIADNLLRRALGHGGSNGTSEGGNDDG